MKWEIVGHSYILVCCTKCHENVGVVVKRHWKTERLTEESDTDIRFLNFGH